MAKLEQRSSVSGKTETAPLAVGNSLAMLELLVPMAGFINKEETESLPV